MRVDLHIHTTAYSPCSVLTPEEMMSAAKEAGLDGVCITEHNKIWTADEARALSEQFELPVFRAMEVTTTGGDILVYGLETEPDGMVSPAELKTEVDRAGAVAIAAHPFRGFLLFGFQALQMDLSAAMDNPTFSQVHGLEVCNSMVTDDENNLAARVADELGLIKIGGSDAHKAEAIGTCVTIFNNTIANEQEMIAAILNRELILERAK